MIHTIFRRSQSGIRTALVACAFLMPMGSTINASLDLLSDEDLVVAGMKDVTAVIESSADLVESLRRDLQ